MAEQRKSISRTIVMGVDPGTLATGYGLIARSASGSLTLLTSGIIANTSRLPMQTRLKKIADDLRGVMQAYSPDEFAIETSFYGKNAQSALKLGQARGVCLVAAADHKLIASEYSPREVKRSVVGNGAASKQQVQFMVRTLLSLGNRAMAFDASDALAVALCHLNRMHTGVRSATSWKKFIEQHPERVMG